MTALRRVSLIAGLVLGVAWMGWRGPHIADDIRYALATPWPGGVGDRRVLISDLISDPVEIRCGEGVAEGARWSQSGTMLLLLCRRPGARVAAFDLWLYGLGAPGSACVVLIRGITWGGVDTHGYAPDLFTHTAWSRAVATLSP